MSVKETTRKTTRRSRLGTAVCIALLATGALLTTVGQLTAASAAANGLELITEPSAGMTRIYHLLEGAKRSVDLTMYELSDPKAEAILVTDRARGVNVRVLLDQHYEQSQNTPAFNYLTAHRVEVRWAPTRYDLTHEKSAVIDGTIALVMSLNFTAQYYATTRDFAVVDTKRTDVVAIENVFAADWSNRTIAPPHGADLVWSPGAEPALVELIGSARHSLLVENEEMNDPYITAPLEAAARRGVRVEVVMTRSNEWTDAFNQLTAAGVLVRTYAPSASLYIHAKVIVVDAGYAGAKTYLGSQNFSIASLVYNRELGLVTTSSAITNGVASIVRQDFAHATPWR
ncbi:MAG TPA: phospholipase D-like domain-containing protein [Acidimicrobiales bacterium]|nr:phospholipase D-like domain-containing protein [Acidimicrobiales bacterium]